MKNNVRLVPVSAEVTLNIMLGLEVLIRAISFVLAGLALTGLANIFLLKM